MEKILEIRENISDFIDKHPEICAIGLIGLLSWFFLFLGLNAYPLIDVDETRYAVMARDLINSDNWNVLLLNGVPFLEKPPLYFWLVGLSTQWFGGFSEFSVRFPIAVLATFIVYFTYFVAKKIVNRKFALISSIILLSSLFFLMLSHVAILDMVLTVFIAATLYCGLLSHYVQDKNKKYCWWGFYLFAGIGVLAKGILGIALPFVIMFLFNLALGKIKEIFKPVNFIIGLILFFVVSMPWHVIMYRDFGYFFIQDYFIYHHFSRFVNSAHIGRQRPFLYFVPVFLGGFFPWSIVFINVFVNGVKKLFAKIKGVWSDVKIKEAIIIEEKTNVEKLMIFSWIYFVVIFLIVSISSTKLPTYILPLFPAAAFLTAKFFYDQVDDEPSKTLKISTLAISGVFILAGILLVVGKFFIPQEIFTYVSGFKYFLMIGMPIVGLILLGSYLSKKSLSMFATHVLVMAFVAVFSVVFLFKLIYSGGQHELVNFSKNVANISNSRLITFDFPVKPSVLINHYNVKFITDIDFKMLSDDIKNNEDSEIFMITRNRQVVKYDYGNIINEQFVRVKKGEIYSLYKLK